MEAILTDTLINEQLYLWPSSQNPVFLNSNKNIFLIFTFPWVASFSDGHLFCIPRVSAHESYTDVNHVLKDKTCNNVRKQKLNRFTVYMTCEKIPVMMMMMMIYLFSINLQSFSEKIENCRWDSLIGCTIY